MKQTSRPNQYLCMALGSEELALALGLINRPDLGAGLLASVHGEYNDVQFQAFQTAAAHSLVARELCQFSDKNSLILAPFLEQAVFPLVRFDYLVKVNLAHKEAQQDALVHILGGRIFTAHFVLKQFIHHLEHGTFSQLPDYLASIFGDLGTAPDRPGDSDESQPVAREISLGLLMRLQENGAAPDQAARLLAESGWSAESSQLLADDLANQLYRGTLLRIDASEDMTPEALKQAPQRMQLVLKSPERSWLFEFMTTSEQALGSARTVSRSVFLKALSAFLA